MVDAESGSGRTGGPRLYRLSSQQLTPDGFKPLPVDDPKVRQPDIARARRLLGWRPKVDFESGIRETVGYFKHKLTF
jgi:nucleoside-diphosphate-sugar epimerase